MQFSSEACNPSRFLKALKKALPRSYPIAFGRKMAEMLPAFNSSPALRPTTMVDASTVAKLCRMDISSDDWSEAGLWDLLVYVYGAKGLCIPDQWKICFPGSLFA